MEWIRLVLNDSRTYPELPHPNWSFTSICVIGAIRTDEGVKRVLPLWYTRDLDKNNRRQEYFKDVNGTKYDRQIMYWSYLPRYPVEDQVLNDDFPDD